MTTLLKFILPFVLLFTKSAAEGLIHFTYMNHIYQSGIRILFQPEGDANMDGQTTALIKFSQFNTTCNQPLQTLPEDPWYNMIWSSQGKYYYLDIQTRTMTPGQCIAYKMTLCTAGGCQIFYVGSRQYQVPNTIVCATDQELLASRESFNSSTTTSTATITTTTTATTATDTSTTVSTNTTSDDIGVAISFTYQNRRECTGLRVQYRLTEAETNEKSIPSVDIIIKQYYGSCGLRSFTWPRNSNQMSWNNEEKYFYITFDFSTLISGYCIAYRIIKCGGDVEHCRVLNDVTQYYQVPPNINHCAPTRTVFTTMRSTIIRKTASSESRSKSTKKKLDDSTTSSRSRSKSTEKKLDDSTQAILISLSIVGLVVLFIGITCSVTLNNWIKKQRRACQREIRAQNADFALQRAALRTACRTFVRGSPENNSTPPSYNSLYPRLERPRHTPTVDSSNRNENRNVFLVDTAPSAPPFDLLDIEDPELMNRTGTRNNIQNENNVTRNYYSQQRRSTRQPQDLLPSYHSEMLTSHPAQSMPNDPPPQYGRF